MNGADALLGRGDMLFAPGGMPKPMRLQGCYVTEEEVEKVVSFIKGQTESVHVLPSFEQSDGEMEENSQYDELYDDAVKLILETEQASTSMLQRRFKIGYTRAARLIDIMEDNRIVGPNRGSRVREILVNAKEYLTELDSKK